MPHFRRPTIHVLFVLSCCVAPSAFAQTPGAKLVVYERAESDKVTLHGGGGTDNVGDVLTFANPVFDAADKKQLGSDQGFCVRVVRGAAFDCHWTTSLANGQIMVAGPYLDHGDSALAIVGGTGAFAAARGEMALHAVDAKGSAYVFTFRFK